MVSWGVLISTYTPDVPACCFHRNFDGPWHCSFRRCHFRTSWRREQRRRHEMLQKADSNPCSTPLSCKLCAPAYAIRAGWCMSCYASLWPASCMHVQHMHCLNRLLHRALPAILSLVSHSWRRGSSSGTRTLSHNSS